MSVSEDEGVVTRRGPLYSELAAANSRLDLFAANPHTEHSRFDMPPPPYRSSRGTTPSDSGPDPPENEDTEESRRALRASLDEMKRIIASDEFAGMNDQQRRRAIEHQKWLRNRRLAREAEEKRKEAEFWASRTPATEPIFGPNLSLPVKMQDGKFVPIYRAPDEPVLPAPKKAQGRPRRSKVHQEANPPSGRSLSRKKDSAQTEQRNPPGRSARIAARAAAAAKALPPVQEPKVSKVSRVSKRGRPRRRGR